MADDGDIDTEISADPGTRNINRPSMTAITILSVPSQPLEVFVII